MSRMEASEPAAPKTGRHFWKNGPWKKRIVVAASAVAVVGVSLGLRSLWKSDDASAQAPAQRGPQNYTPPDIAGVRPASATGAPVATPSAAVAKPALPAPTRVVAVVNGEEISRVQLGQECIRRFGEDVLTRIVNKELILQECKARGIVITQQEVDDEISVIAKRFNLTNDRWLAMLKQQRDITPEQYRLDVIWPTVALRRLAKDQITVDPKELNQAYESEYGPSVSVRLISITKKDVAEKIHAQVAASPNDFARFAQDYSEDKASASVGGQIAPIRRGIGDAKIEEVAFGLKMGEVSPVLFVANQYFILKCEKQNPPRQIDAKTRMEFISRLEDKIRDNKLRSVSAKLFSTLQEKAKVVNVYNDAKLRDAMPGVAATINGQPISLADLSEECISRHGQEVLQGEINRKLLEQALRKSNKTITEADIDAEIDRAARSFGFVTADGKADIVTWLKMVTKEQNINQELYVRDVVWPSVVLKLIVGTRVEVSKEDLQRGFEANYGERVETMAIVLNDQRRAQEVWDMARNNPTEEFFGQLAHQYSIEPVSKANFGKVPPIKKHGGQPTIEAEAFRLQPGQISGVIAVDIGNKADQKFIIMRCNGRTKPVTVEFNAVKDLLTEDIHEKKLRGAMAAEFDRIKAKATIDNLLAGTTQIPQKSGAAAQAGALPAGSAMLKP